LEDNTRDNNTKRLLKGPEKTIYSAGKRQVGVKGRGLGGKTLRTKEHAKADASDEGEEDLKEYIS
jgi:hypothetical protein